MVLVTGATGHLGTVLVHQLTQRGEQVRYVCRGDVPEGLRNSEGTPVPADLSDEVSLRQAVDGVDVVYHAAAKISILRGEWESLHAVNVEGTRNLLQAAREAGVKRFVYVGSIEAFPLAQHIRPVTENQTVNPAMTAIEYGRSKAMGLLDVLNSSSAEMECVACCPTSFIGPPDYRRSPMGQVIFDFLAGKLPAYVTGGFDWVDVRDVAAGIIRAAENGRPGQVYLLSGHYATIPELMDMLQSLSGVAKPKLWLPRGMLLPLMPIVESYYRQTGISPKFTRSSIKLISLDVTVDSSKAARELGYATRPLEETLADTVAWFRNRLL